MNNMVNSAKESTENNSKSIKQMERKLAKVEKRNTTLESENLELKEKLLDLEYRQRRNNLVFEGIPDSEKETDIQCMNKLRNVLNGIPGLDTQKFCIDRCHRLDGPFHAKSTRRVICAFNWYYDVQCILRNRKQLPRGIYVSEDLPEEWIDRRKILKPLYNAAKKTDALKARTHLSKDKLIIDGKSFSAGPHSNYSEASSFVDLQSTCQRSDSQKIIFLGPHSPFSNLFLMNFSVNNVKYSCVEQYLQSEKAGIFDDDVTRSKIMNEMNPFKMKKLGSKVKNFAVDRWRKHSKQIAYTAILAKFSQNHTLRNCLIETNNLLIAESSLDPYWGTGTHLFDRVALDSRHWKNEGGVMSDILARVCRDVQK